ncbi:MAG: hypothetical protein GXP55_21815 [Deltaproteobacteria bacterium]|nr:hypothetical protein [Deltaproteobacteria bacterium]
MKYGVAILLTSLGLCALPRTSHAQVPEGMTFDDGYTFYEIEDHQDFVNGHPVDVGWALKGQFRVFGRTASESSFKMVIKKGRRTLGETTCDVSRRDWVAEVSSGPAQFFTNDCLDNSQRIRESGNLDVLVYYIDDDTDAEHLLRTYHIRVVEVSRVRGNGEPDAPHHYVDRNGEELTSILHLQHNRAPAYFDSVNGRSLSKFDGKNVVTLLVNLTPDEAHGSVSLQGSMRCSVNGERVQIADSQIHGDELRHVYEVQTHGQGRRDERELVIFRQFVLRLPLSFHDPIVTQTHERWHPLEHYDESLTYIDEHPGQWECQWRENRVVLRTFRWTVTEDGHVAPHAEQGAGFGLGANAYLVETVIPNGGSGYETRVERAALERRPFYGLGWHTDEGRALAHAAPNVGTPAPTARHGRSGRRGRHGRH